MTRTPEKLVESYLEWKKATFPEWSRSKGLEADGITTQDPATRTQRAEEARHLIEDLKSVQTKLVEDIDIDIRLCIDDGMSSIATLESQDLKMREIIDLIAPDAGEKPWIENLRWLAAAKTMPRALARAQASGPWIKELLSVIALELEEASLTRDPVRHYAATSAANTCKHLAQAVGYRQTAQPTSDVPSGAWQLAKEIVEKDRRRLDIALANAAPGLLPESAMTQLTEEITDRSRVLGLSEKWKDTLKDAVINSGWAQVPPHGEASFEIMPESRSYTSANLRSIDENSATIIVALPMNSAMLPLMVAHETYPGHLLQKTYQASAPSEAMRLLGSSMSSEGWAHYAEMKINELGLADPGSFEIGLASRSLLRSVRLLARIGIVKGKLSENAVYYLFNSVALLSPEIAKRETVRAQWDHKAIDYALGRRGLDLMEAEFVGRGMGDASAFRSKVLPIMCAPLDMIAKRLGLRRPEYV
jgi:hypothetical protein